MMKSKRAAVLTLIFFLLASSALAGAQTASSSLTVRDIMSEPSIAGMRPAGERLAPDGQHVVYLWSVTGKEPLDLYLVETRGEKPGTPLLLVRAVDAPKEAREDKTQTKDQATTGGRKEERVMQRDAAQQAREQSINAVEWSPDSKRLLFSKGGDLYTIGLEMGSVPQRLTR
ncbi:MAG: hypothetical protein JO360_16885, partial [Acidobacteria bacterium]|nr:hypothetical protein [Acidobacteriota bacterium]